MIKMIGIIGGMEKDGNGLRPCYSIYHDEPLHILWVYRERDCISGPFSANLTGWRLCSEIINALALGTDFDGKLSRNWGEA